MNCNLSQYYRRIPAAWIIAQNTLTLLVPKLSLRLTDTSHIYHGDISISHTLKQCHANGIVIQSIMTKGICMLSDAGSWSRNPNGKVIFTTTKDPAPLAQWTPKARQHWKKIATLLSNLDTAWLFDGNPALMTPRSQCQTEAKDYIQGLQYILSLPPSSPPHQNHIWGSDGSMIPATSGIGEDKLVTAAITSPQMIAVRLNSRNLSIMHGELIGLIMGLILLDNRTPNNKLFTDHLNSTCFIEDARTSINQENCLKNMNGCSYYGWILDLARRTQMEVAHMKAHTHQVNLPSLLNAEADHYASKSQKMINSLHLAPIPTFLMDKYTFFQTKDGWIKFNICSFIDHFITWMKSLALQEGNRYRMATWLYDP